jgi:ATP-binding cassette subfamily F protein uup
MDFPGAVVLVTHDRFLLDRVSTEIIGLDGRGGTRRFSCFAEWEERERELAREAAREARRAAARRASRRGDGREPLARSPARRAKLTGGERRELEGMEDAILSAELAPEAAKSEVADPAVAADPDRLRAACEALHEAELEVERLYDRWAALDERGRSPG